MCFPPSVFSSSYILQMVVIQLLYMMICAPSNYTFLTLGESVFVCRGGKMLLLFLNPHSMLA